jgi:sensor histidine kinase regulating citrate/malate metabolism
VADQSGARSLSLTASHKEGMAIIHIFTRDLNALTGASPVLDETLADDITDSGPVQPLSGMGLSACQGILEQHHGQISWHYSRSTGITIRVELPVMAMARGKSTNGHPVMWQPQASS